MKLKKIAVAAAVSAAMSVAVAGQAQAGAFAEALLDVTNFQLGTYSTTFTAFDLSQFAQLSINDNGTNNAVIVGQPSVTNNANSTALLANMNNLQALVGTYGGGENNFTPSGVPPVNLFSRADSLLQGTPITAIGLGITTAGVRAVTISETSLPANANGNAGSTLNLTSTLNFVTNTSITNAAISFDANQILRAWTSADSKPGSSAGANTGWSITLTHQDPNTGAAIEDFQWNPNGNVGGGTHTGLTEVADGCNLAQNVSASFNQQFSPFTCSGTFLAVANGVTLVAGLNYSLNINHSSGDNAVSVVPEPGSLALLGLGLLGLGFSGFRRKSA